MQRVARIPLRQLRLVISAVHARRTVRTPCIGRTGHVGGRERAVVSVVSCVRERGKGEGLGAPAD